MTDYARDASHEKDTLSIIPDVRSQVPALSHYAKIDMMEPEYVLYISFVITDNSANLSRGNLC